MQVGKWRGNPYAPYLEPVRRRPTKSVPNPALLGLAADDFGFDPTSLMEFVLKSRVDLLSERTYDRERGWVVAEPADQLQRRQIAGKLAWDGSTFSTFISKSGKKASESERPSVRRFGQRASGFSAQARSKRFRAKAEVDALEATLHVFAMRERHAPVEVMHAYGTMTAFWQELLGSGETSSSSSALHGRWFRDLVEAGPQNAAEALMAGEALLALLLAASEAADAVLLVDAHRQQVTRTVRGLLTVATRPPGRGSMPAAQMLSLLGCLPVQWDDDGASKSVPDLVLEHVTDSPVGFRTIPVLTRIVLLSAGRYGALPAWWSSDGVAEREAVWRVLRQLHETPNTTDPYPARSFVVEALRTIRMSERSVSEAALEMLQRRASDDTRTVRERAYASYSVYEASRGRANEVAALCGMLRLSREHEAGPDEGLAYAATLIELLERDRSPGASLESLLLVAGNATESDDGPRDVRDELALDLAVQEVDEILYPGRTLRNPRAASQNRERYEAAEANQLLLDRVPGTVREAFVSLVRYALLSIDGSARRRAAETLREAGLGTEAACLILQVMESDAEHRVPAWVREHAAFLLGHLTDPVALDALLEIARTAGPDEVDVRWAAIWALGDIAHPDPAVVATLLEILERPGRHPLSVVRAATYALAALFPDSDESRDVVTATLRKLASDHPNPLVADLAKWGLVERERAHDRSAHRTVDELWGIQPDLRATLDSVVA
jgi:hypothetical protein